MMSEIEIVGKIKSDLVELFASTLTQNALSYLPLTKSSSSPLDVAIYFTTLLDQYLTQGKPANINFRIVTHPKYDIKGYEIHDLNKRVAIGLYFTVVEGVSVTILEQSDHHCLGRTPKCFPFHCDKFFNLICDKEGNSPNIRLNDQGVYPKFNSISMDQNTRIEFVDIIDDLFTFLEELEEDHGLSPINQTFDYVRHAYWTFKDVVSAHHGKPDNTLREHNALIDQVIELLIDLHRSKEPVDFGLYSADEELPLCKAFIKLYPYGSAYTGTLLTLEVSDSDVECLTIESKDIATHYSSKTKLMLYRVDELPHLKSHVEASIKRFWVALIKHLVLSYYLWSKDKEDDTSTYTPSEGLMHSLEGLLTRKGNKAMQDDKLKKQFNLIAYACSDYVHANNQFLGGVYHDIDESPKVAILTDSENHELLRLSCQARVDEHLERNLIVIMDRSIPADKNTTDHNEYAYNVRVTETTMKDGIPSPLAVTNDLFLSNRSIPTLSLNDGKEEIDYDVNFETMDQYLWTMKRMFDRTKQTVEALGDYDD